MTGMIDHAFHSTNRERNGILVQCAQAMQSQQGAVLGSHMPQTRQALCM